MGAPGRRLILQVKWGPQASRKAVVEPGQVLRVGRAVEAGLSLEHDASLSEAHFEVGWDGRSGWLRDLGSAQGTRVDGQRVDRGEVGHGTWVRAGSTDWCVYVERATPPPEEGLQEEAGRQARAGAVLALLRQERLPLFAVLDAARDRRVLQLLRESVEECRSLYEGTEGEVLEEQAPHLVHLPPGSELLELLVREGWGKSWGVYLTCTLPLLEVRRHLRKLLRVRLEGREGWYYLRFYDPRVLRALWPTCGEAQRQQLLGPLRSLVLECEAEQVVRLEADRAAAYPQPARGYPLEMSQAQLFALREGARTDFIQRVAQELSERMAEDLAVHGCTQPPQVEARVRRAVVEAESHGITQQEDPRLYVQLTVLLLPGLAREKRWPWAEEILKDPELTGTQKVNALQERVLFGDPWGKRE
jgi:hypothetical protein